MFVYSAAVLKCLKASRICLALQEEGSCECDVLLLFQKLPITLEEREMTMDLTPFVNPAPYTVTDVSKLNVPYQSLKSLKRVHL